MNVNAAAGTQTASGNLLESNGSALCPSDDTDAERIFKHFFSEQSLFSTIVHMIWSPPTDVYETHDKYVVRMEIPGIDVADVKIDLNHNVLTIRGHRRDKCADTKISFHQMEIHFGYFEKVITLPHSIDSDVRSATLVDGFLCVTIRKALPRPSARRRIEIEH